MSEDRAPTSGAMTGGGERAPDRPRMTGVRFAPRVEIVEAVQITAADFNPALDWDKAWDGSPFTAWPQWLHDALRSERLTPHNRGHTDYAGWDLKSHYGSVSSGRPGDWIVHLGDGLMVIYTDEAFTKTYCMA